MCAILAVMACFVPIVHPAIGPLNKPAVQQCTDGPHMPLMIVSPLV